MELSTTIIGVLILALFILPVFFIARSINGKSKKFEKEFFSEVSRNELTISEKDFWNEYAIGIDLSANKIIYFDWSGPDRIITLFHLEEVKVFEPVPDYSELNKKNFNFKRTNRLGLRFKFNDPSKGEIYIPLFMAGFGTISDKEIDIFKKWLKLIKGKIDPKSLKNLKHTA